MVRTEDMKKLGIKAYKQDGTPFTQAEMLELRKQFIFYQQGCLKVSQLTTPEVIDNDTVPVLLEMAEAKKQKNCYCDRDFIETEVKDLIKTIKGTESIFNHRDCTIQDSDRKDIKESSITLLFNKNVSIMLEKQIEYRKASFDNPYQYSQKDLDITITILMHLPTDNGYKQISNDEFNDKIRLIFNRIIDRNSSSNYLYINFLNKCNKATNNIPNNAENNGVFVMKKVNFITELYPLPSIIEYQKAYSEVSQEENNISKTYKDANGNEVSKYLLNLTRTIHKIMVNCFG